MTEQMRNEMMESAAEGFEGQLEDVETIVARLESGEVELEEALALFERGVARLRQAGRLLDRAEGRVEELIVSATTGELDREELQAPDAHEVEGERA